MSFGGEGPIALVKNHHCRSAAQDLILNCCLWVTRSCVSHNSVTQSVCTNNPTCLKPGPPATRRHRDPVLSKTSRHLPVCVSKGFLSPTPCHWGLCSPFPSGIRAPLSTHQSFRKSGPQSSSQRQSTKYTWSRGDQNTEAPHKARRAGESQKQRDSKRQRWREAWPTGPQLVTLNGSLETYQGLPPTDLCIRLRGAEARVLRVRSLDPAWQLIACTRPLSRSLSPEQPPPRTVTPLLLPSGTVDKVASLMHLSPEGQRQGVSPSLPLFQLCHQNARRRRSPASKVLGWGGPGQRAWISSWIVLARTWLRPQKLPSLSWETRWGADGPCWSGSPSPQGPWTWPRWEEQAYVLKQ